MAQRTITVDLNPPDKHGHQCLHLTDSEGHDETNPELMVTDVDPGDTVRWVIKSGSDITALKGIEKVGGTELFSQAPALQSDGSYLGTIISRSPGAGVSENYNIWYTRSGSSLVIKEDPKIRMKT